MGFLLLSGASSAAPSAELWERWLNHEPDSELTIDHQAWSTFLNRYLKADHSDGVNRVAYSAVTEQDRQSLRDYIQRLSTAPVSTLNRSEQKAFWINLYNAITVDVVLTHYPVRSIKKIRLGGLFSGPWDAPLVTIEGEALSLNDIEHRILRPIWRDPLIHYGVNCASLGCPNLLQEAYTGRNVDRLLAQNAKCLSTTDTALKSVSAEYDCRKFIAGSKQTLALHPPTHWNICADMPIRRWSPRSRASQESNTSTTGL